MSTFTIRRGTALHQALAFLRAMSLTPQQLMRAMEIDGRRERDAFIDDVLTPLFVHGMAERDGHAWVLTEAGLAEADRLGAFGAADPTRTAAGIDRASALAHELLAASTPCKPRLAIGTGDMRPAPYREGSLEARRHPSRRGDRLYWPDGRVTDLSGTVEHVRCVTA